MLKTVIVLLNNLSATDDIVRLMPISNMLKGKSNYRHCCVVERNIVSRKGFSVLAVVVIKCVEGFLTHKSDRNTSVQLIKT